MTKHSGLDRVALGLLVATVLIWSSNWVVMKQMAHYIGPFTLVALRYLLAFVLVAPITLMMGRSMRFPPFWLTAGGALAQMAGFQCLSQYALISGGAGHVVMLAYTMPFWVGLFAWLLLGEKITARFLCGLAVCAVGLLAIIAPWQGLGGMESSVAALASGFCWGLGVVISKRTLQKHKVDVMGLTAWQMLLGGLFCLPLIWIFPQQETVWAPQLYFGMAYMTIMATAVGWLLWMSVVQRVSASIAGMSSLLVPALVLLQAWFWLDEFPSWLEWGGIALIMVGLLVVTMPVRQGEGRAAVKA
ncbi:DMT family transporter [Paracandidimonas soli]|uniref:DMT family transporter n=1 Tax=Paracandidimonas soli TaxID=1917182 RepID=UPI003341BF24